MPTLRASWGQTDLELSPQEILNRSDPKAPDPKAPDPKAPRLQNRSDPKAPWRPIAEASSETSLAQEEVALAPVLRSAGPRARGDAWFDRIAFSRLLGRTFRSSRCGSAPSGSRSGRVLSVVIRPKSPTDGS